MLLKFLFGSGRSFDMTAEDTKENLVLKDTLLLTRKTDSLQHSDMKIACFMPPSTGGFVRRCSKPDTMDFYGESVSCRVQTDDSMKELYAPLVTEGQWWKFSYTHNTSIPKTIFAVTEPGFKPSSLVSNNKWEPSSHAEMLEIVEAEAERAGGW